MNRSLRPGAGDEVRHIIADGQFDPERRVRIWRGIVGLQGLPQATPAVHGIFAAVPYCIDLIGGPYMETDDAVVKAFRPKTALRSR
mgnify:CR=1 FL=1